MAYKKGDRVKATHGTPHMPKGSHGTIHSTHTGTFHGVSFGSGIVFLPAQSLTDPDHDGDNDTPGGTDTDNDMVKASADIAEVISFISDQRRRRR